MSQLRQHIDEFEQLGLQVKIISFDSVELAKRYVAGTKSPFPVLLDENRQLYKHYGMHRAAFSKLIGPITILKYVGQILSGNGSLMVGKDVRQLGGDVLIDPEGRVRLHHVSSGPHDRPSPESILAAMT